MVIKLDYWDGVTAEAAADELERVAGMIRDGYTSGQLVNGLGDAWWSTEDEFADEDSEECASAQGGE